MKKQLLLGTALLAAVTSYSQNSRAKAIITGEVNMSEKLASKYATVNNPHEPAAAHTAKQAPSQNGSNIEVTSAGDENMSAVAAPTVQWKAIAGSMNIYGVLVSNSKPLQYNDQLNAVSFVHRKGGTYTTLPFSTSGSIVMHLSQNWGSTWDSTCIWASDDGVMRARYPQGGIYNPAGNTNISNAYGVGMGPLTNGSGWIGNFYASKQLGSANYNATAVTGNGMQFAPNTPPYLPGLQKHDFSRYSFASTDDGLVRSIGGRYDATDGNGQPIGFRGAAVVKGTFVGGNVTWTSDTIIPATIQSSVSGNNLWGQPIMAWNEAGTIGYVVFIGSDATYSAQPNSPNRGWQPIVYKTTNSGGSWAKISGIDFTAPSMSVVTDYIASVNTNTALGIPFFNIGESYDAVVDANGKLHIASTIVGTARAHDDSLNYTFQFTPNGYGWGHTPGFRPYLYDFVGDGSAPWEVIVVDSLSSEGPGATSTSNGYTANPWDPDPANSNQKVSSDSRIQLSRDVSGQYIIYSWAESDTNFTNAQEKWNSLPNIKARCLLVSAGSMTMSPTEINVTKPTPAVPGTFSVNANVSNRAMFHYMSTTALFANCVGSNTVQIKVPFSVTNSNPYSQLTENRHWVSAGTLEFGGLTTCTGIQQNLAYNVKNIEIFPNPAHSKATIAVDLEQSGNVNVSIFNTVGQLVQSSSFEGQFGVNKTDVSLENLSAGMYIVNVKVGNATSTKKLIIE
ncbi:MAG: T9SS type A sorting domain-containing protein [Sphingobacteriaceae bacterium]|nr:T9SS type A sorting domain-containing protein [Sphingobacteriaceae bacterium]